MKRLIALLLAFVMCFSLCACGSKSETEAEVEVETEPVSKTPTVAEIVEGIKFEFKDPDSVQMSDVHIAKVEDSENEYYAIGTVRAKNSFGGYGDPETYVIHCDNGSYEIVGEYNDASYMIQNAFNELGCGANWVIS